MRIALVGVDPRVANVGLHLSLEEGLDSLGERHALGVAKFRIGFGVAVPVQADRSCLVALGQGGQDRLGNRSGDPDAGFRYACFEHPFKLLPVLVEATGERTEEFADRFLLGGTHGPIWRIKPNVTPF